MLHVVISCINPQIITNQTFRVRADLVDDPCEGVECCGVGGDGDTHPGAVLHTQPQHPRHGVLHLIQCHSVDTRVGNE